MKSWIIRHAERLEKAAWIGAALLTAGLLIAAALLPTHRLFLAVYIAPLLPTGAWWLSLRRRSLSETTEPQLITDCVAFGLGGLRVFGGWGLLPHSGHMLFLTYSILTTGSLAYRSWAVLLLLMTTEYKLAIRHDFYSWSWGLGLGVLLAVGWRSGSRDEGAGSRG